MPDEGGRTVLTFAPNKLRTTPLSPTYHLRANDFVIAAPPTKNQALPPTIAAQSNPAPSGAPAGGISFAKRCHITPRTAEKKPSPSRGKVARQRRMRAKSASVAPHAFRKAQARPAFRRSAKPPAVRCGRGGRQKYFGAVILRRGSFRRTGLSALQRSRRPRHCSRSGTPARRLPPLPLPSSLRPPGA